MTSNLTKIEWKDRTKETKSHKTDISDVNTGRNGTARNKAIQSYLTCFHWELTIYKVHM